MLPTSMHNKIYDITTIMMKEVGHNFCIEPSFQPLNGEKFQDKDH